MPRLAGKPGFRFKKGHFDALTSRNCRQESITTAGIREGLDQVEAAFVEKGVYEALKKSSPYFVPGE